ncbi:HAD family hydrolase [Arthrobacter sp.]|uniref:HAD family hydrolase n=1 Tax=Arthrobacter sp. TaxID=1667 RepID=UPI003A915600
MPRHPPPEPGPTAPVDAHQCARDYRLGRAGPADIEESSHDAVVLGDAVWDIHACTKISLPTIGLCSGGTGAAELQQAGADQVHAHPAELLEQLGSSILGELLERARGF